MANIIDHIADICTNVKKVLALSLGYYEISIIIFMIYIVNIKSSLTCYGTIMNIRDSILIILILSDNQVILIILLAIVALYKLYLSE